MAGFKFQEPVMSEPVPGYEISVACVRGYAKTLPPQPQPSRNAYASNYVLNGSNLGISFCLDERMGDVEVFFLKM